jgi:uncharacterized RDD family membrane protein YckC
MPFCNKCGNEYSSGETKCSKCGEDFQSFAVQDTKIVSVRDKTRLKRFVAGAIDLGIALALFALLFFSRTFSSAFFTRRSIALVLPLMYLLLKDSIEGKSIGKMLTGILVYNEQERKAGGIFDSIIRNWYLAIPVIGPTLMAIVIGAQILSGKKKRLGDDMADTVVISDAKYQRIK